MTKRKRSNKWNKHKNRQLKEDQILFNQEVIDNWKQEVTALDFVNLACRIYLNDNDAFSYYGYGEIVEGRYPQLNFILTTVIDRERRETIAFWREWCLKYPDLLPGNSSIKA